jgi:DNA repair exonuclease SbcCD ATPase subunit
MRFLAVRARAFGPLHDRELRLQPGLNVLYGPNEAGKSSWHAALFAGLCGMRRVRGGKSSEDVGFAERHRPWTGEAWSVEVDVELADGRRIQIAQDLADPAHSRAMDLVTGADLTARLLHDGAPDGAVLLGLTRETLPKTICIRQADVLAVLSEPGELQQQIQKAAVNGHADETAEAAIARIREFAAEHVGLRRRTSTKPLQAAAQGFDDACRDLDDARRAHDEYLALVGERKLAHEEACDAERDLLAARTALLRSRISAQRARVERARSLASRFPAGAPADSAAAVERLSALRHALSAFDSRPAAPRPEEARDAQAIEAETRELPDVPSTDFEPASQPVRPSWPSRRALVGVGAALAAIGLLTVVVVPSLLGPALAVAATGVVVLLVAALRRSPSWEDSEAVRHERTRWLERVERAERKAKESAAEDLRKRKAEEDRILALAGEFGVGDAALEDRVAGLREIASDMQEEIACLQRDREAWAALQEVLAGRSLRDLEADLERLLRTAPPALAGEPTYDPGPDPETKLRDLEKRLDQARGRRERLSGRVEAHERALADVCAAEEARDRARRELSRVESLQATLDRTREFLEAARDRVQRDIAPRLGKAVQDRLAAVTGDRYHEAIVDPASLEVQVRIRGGEWRPATSLSHGTAEQIYLLVRIALAEHLGTAGEPAPLLLDDVTVQIDAARTLALLDVLHRISRERQVVLFSQEQEVVSWARATLVEPMDLLLEMSALPTGVAERVAGRSRS